MKLNLDYVFKEFDGTEVVADGKPYTLKDYFIRILGSSPRKKEVDSIHAYELGLQMTKCEEGLLPIQKRDVTFLRTIIKENVTTIAAVIYGQINDEFERLDAEYRKSSQAEEAKSE